MFSNKIAHRVFLLIYLLVCILVVFGAYFLKNDKVKLTNNLIVLPDSVWRFDFNYKEEIIIEKVKFIDSSYDYFETKNIFPVNKFISPFLEIKENKNIEGNLMASFKDSNYFENDSLYVNTSEIFELDRLDVFPILGFSFFLKDAHLSPGLNSNLNILTVRYGIFNNNLNLSEYRLLNIEKSVVGNSFSFDPAPLLDKWGLKDSASIYINLSKFNQAYIERTFFPTFDIRNSHFNFLGIDNCSFIKEFSIKNCDFRDTLMFQNCIFHKIPDFSNSSLPEVLIFENINFKLDPIEDKYSKIEFRNTKNFHKRKTKIKFIDSQVDKFLLSYNDFELVFEPKETYESKTRIYEDIINNCKTNGLIESYKSWDVEYRSMKMKHDFPLIGDFLIEFNKYWWNFGYEKWRILVIWLPTLFLFFLLCNWFFIDLLYKYVYKDDELAKSNFHHIIQKFFKNGDPDFSKNKFTFAYTFFYTANVYFGMKLKLNAINYSNFWGMVYIFLMYIGGSIHLAFSLSYILSVY